MPDEREGARNALQKWSYPNFLKTQLGGGSSVYLMGGNWMSNINKWAGPQALEGWTVPFTGTAPCMLGVFWRGCSISPTPN